MVKATAAGGEILIKKYSNRRLYDTRRSRYITLDDLAGMIRDGATVKVVDANKGSDLTRLVLTQVILEEQDRIDLLPVDLLHHIIKVQGTMM
ncbi:MAG: polyhydroxyalkanoate synthesis regulator DNA-binding domain-containing protein, partial [Myxococcota bacterium]|nr:polyhydroxyalkanoate synthesis regulator DNA-binding domain-containing protein [Myxococcota bacterium]